MGSVWKMIRNVSVDEERLKQKTVFKWKRTSVNTVLVFSYNGWLGLRIHDKESETISSYKISPDPSDFKVLIVVSLSGFLWDLSQGTGMARARPWFCG